MNSLVEENYLKALFSLSNEDGEVNVSELSDRLGIKMPTVTSMMKKLAAKDLVYYESYKPIRLTNAGRIAAALIIRKHRLTEMFLVEKMGFGWEDVHPIAEQVEHIKAPEFFDKMDELLGYPKVDPHGSPIPDKNGNLPSISYKRLSDCADGDVVFLAAVTNSSEDFLKFLNSRDIQLGLKIEVQSTEPFDQSMSIRCGSRPTEVFSFKVCERLLVEKSK
jgi:DtxR family transcriptional regulator, Mn-dependent transcriptional regulator